MAHVPEGATLIDNPVSTAPGFHIGNVFVLAGVPSIMQAMFDGAEGSPGGRRARAVAHRQRASSAKASSPPGLGALQERYADLEIGSYPFFARASTAPASCCAAPSRPASTLPPRNSAR